MRLDKKISELYPELSRSRIQKLIEEGNVFVNTNSVQKSSFNISESDVIDVIIPETKDREDLIPENIPLDILFENDDYLVINKAKGMSVHPGDDEGSYSGTVVNAVLFHCGNSLSGINGEKRPGIVHRLDKDTTGVLIVAKNDTFHRFISEQMEQRKVKKIYRALVSGNPQNGIINAPIARSLRDRKKMAVKAGGRDSLTEFQVLHYFPKYDVSLVEVNLLTGRTHQIRVHFASIGHPVVGDALYGAEKVNKKFEKFSVYSQMLHAYSYTFSDKEGNLQQYVAPIQDPLLREEGNPLDESLSS